MLLNPLFLLLAFSLLHVLFSHSTYVKIWCDMFIPVHRDIHWCLSVIDMAEKLFQYLDYLGGMDCEVPRILVGLSDVFRNKILST